MQTFSGLVILSILWFVIGFTLYMSHLHVEYALIELRVKEGEELIGLDTTQHGEREYGDECRVGV
jgi:ammonia channel protein AmtB